MSSDHQQLLSEAQNALEKVRRQREQLAARVGHAAEEVKNAEANAAETARTGDRKAQTAAASWLTGARHVSHVLAADLEVVDGHVAELQARHAEITDVADRIDEAARVDAAIEQTRECAERFLATTKEFGRQLFGMGLVGQQSAQMLGKMYPEIERNYVATVQSALDYKIGVIDKTRSIVRPNNVTAESSLPHEEAAIERKRVCVEREVLWREVGRGVCSAPRYSLVDLPINTARRAIAAGLAIAADDTKKMDVVRLTRVPQWCGGDDTIVAANAIDLDTLEEAA